MATSNARTVTTYEMEAAGGDDFVLVDRSTAYILKDGKPVVRVNWVYDLAKRAWKKLFSRA